METVCMSRLTAEQLQLNPLRFSGTDVDGVRAETEQLVTATCQGAPLSVLTRTGME